MAAAPQYYSFDQQHNNMQFLNFCTNFCEKLAIWSLGNNDVKVIAAYSLISSNLFAWNILWNRSFAKHQKIPASDFLLSIWIFWVWVERIVAESCISTDMLVLSFWVHFRVTLNQITSLQNFVAISEKVQSWKVVLVKNVNDLHWSQNTQMSFNIFY